MAASAIALSGCVVFMSAPTAKRGKKSVTITIKGCASQSSGSPTGSCTRQGNSHANATPSKSKAQQVLLGFRVPKGSKAPKSFTATTGPIPGGGKLKFSKSKSYTNQLQKFDPAGAGKVWAGYASQLFVYSTSGEQNFTAKAAFGLPTGLKGAFKFLAVIGGRVGFMTTSTIHCGKSLTKLSAPKAKEAIICVDDSASGTG
jgi:hypothetical protein